MGKYMKCPRCELNWILESDEYCDVCKAEMGVEGFHLLEDEEDEILCPVCGANYIDRNKKMCADCLAKSKTGNTAFVSDTETESDAEPDTESQSGELQNDSEEGIEKISFDEIEEEKFDIYDDAFDDQDDFSANDFGKSEFDEEEEQEEEEEVSNPEDDELEADFNYDIDSVEDIDDEDEELDDDEDL